MALDHINVWLLHDDTTFSIVDTGINSRTSKRIWTEVLASCVPDHKIDKVIGTHLHPDHIGLAGWLCRTLQCSLWMTSKEYFLCRLLCEDTGKPAPTEGISYYQACGLDADAIAQYQASFGGFGKVVSTLPQNFIRMEDGDTLRIGPYDWEVVVGSGHSPEHACLFSESINTLISGDQILPTISSIVAVWPTEPEANPLRNWLDSCRRLLNQLPSDVLVLPSHGLPFRGVKPRLQWLIDHHEEKLELLHNYSDRPRRAIDVFDILFKSTINHSNRIMAIGEAIAHYNYLRYKGLVTRHTDPHGVHWYQKV